MTIIRCKDKCPEFNNDILNWIPYMDNDTISFYKGDTLKKLVVTENFVDHTDHVGGCTKCACSEIYAIVMVFDSIQINFSFNDSNNPMSSSIQTNGDYFSADTMIKSFDLNGKLYNDVIIYNCHTNGNSEYSITNKFNTIIISKAIGIIAIYIDSIIWILKDSSLKNKKISDTKYSSNGC